MFALPIIWKVEVNYATTFVMLIPKIMVFFIGISIPGDEVGHDL